MYRITAKTEDAEYLIHEPYDEEIRAINPILTMSMESAGSLAFQMADTHPNVGMLRPLESEVYVFDDEDLIFCGRLIKPVKDFYNTVSVSCEGELAYLIDSRQRPYEFTGTVSEFLEQLLEVHNSQVEIRKQFSLGKINITAVDSEGVSFQSDNYGSTLDVFRNTLMENCGGYPHIRHEGKKRYLDYVNDYGGINEQVIRFGENMLDISHYQDASKIFTCLIPNGADVDYVASDGSTQTKRVDITSVNNGLDYIVHEAGVAKYGRIWGYYRWDNVTDPEVLLAKAKAYLEESVAMPETLEINALDLKFVDVDIEKLKLGCWTTVESIPHKISRQFLLTKKEMHLDDPGKDKVVLGQTMSTFTGNTVKQQIQASIRIEKVASEASREINRKVENATQLITGGLGGYVVIGRSEEDGHPEEILVMDEPDKSSATNVIRLNKNGLGFSTTGYNGPYRNAWTIDGNLVADFITTGTMLADRIRGGTMELGGTGLARDGSIIVKDASGKMIGSWDKTGLSVLRGILQGVSAVFGGLDNQSGAIEVRDASGRLIGRWDKDGLYLIKGSIEVGPFYVDEDGVQLGDFYVSADGTNTLVSEDGSIRIQTEEGGPLGQYAAFKIGGSVVSDHHVDALTGIFGEIYVTENDSLWKGRSLSQVLKDIYNRLGSSSGDDDDDDGGSGGEPGSDDGDLEDDL